MLGGQAQQGDSGESNLKGEGLDTPVGMRRKGQVKEVPQSSEDPEWVLGDRGVGDSESV